MEIRKISLVAAKLATYNPRVTLKPGDGEYEKLERSIKEFGLVEPLVWNKRTGNLVGGHQRFAVLQAQGATEVEVSVVDLPLEKEKTLNIALNKIQGAWDEEKLAGLLRELSEVPDVDISLTGFDQSEITGLFDEYLTPGLDSTLEDGKLAGGPSITQKGDLIHLGPHRLLCGDSTSPEDLKRLLGDAKIKLLYTDAPYNCRYDAAQRPTQGGKDAKWGAIQNDWLEQGEYELWLKKFFEGIKPFLGAGAPIYVWNGHRQFGAMHSILTGLGFHVSNVITWIKPCPAPGYGDYQMQSEFCLYSWLEDNGSHCWFGPPNETNVWEYGRDSVSELIHPTQKPVALAQRAIKNSSQRGDLIFDGFAGSGSAIMAAQSMERVCYAMELEPSYCDAIVRRYVKTFGRSQISEEMINKYVIKEEGVQ